MKRPTKLLMLLLCLGAANCSAGDARKLALQGAWECGPYSMAGPGFESTGTYMSTYASDGSYRETSETEYRLTNGKVVTLRDRSHGSWTLKDDVIFVRYDKVEFLSSDDPTYTVQMGQDSADAQQKKKNWSKSRILELGDRLVKFPVEAMYKGAEVKVSCQRPTMKKPSR